MVGAGRGRRPSRAPSGRCGGKSVADSVPRPAAKTAQLAAAGAKVTAVDRSGPRLARLSENLARLKLTADVREADAASLKAGPVRCHPARRALHRHGHAAPPPDIAWAKRPSDVATLAAVQAGLIDHALDLLKAGGLLVYAPARWSRRKARRRWPVCLPRK